MALKGNKGELSELYAFFRLLADGRLYCADGDLNRYDEKFYPILEVFRNDSPDRTGYKVNAVKNNILVAGQTINLEVPQADFRENAENLLTLIKEGAKDADFSNIEAFMKHIDTHAIKSKSKDKADIRIVIHNLNTGSKPELGYSIKSRLGGQPTLINSNKDGTNFIFKISGVTNEHIVVFNALESFKKKFEYLSSVGATVSYQKVANDVLHRNLMLLDLGLETIIAEGLLNYYSGKASSLAKIADRMTSTDPLGISKGTDQPMYAYKFKQFLLAFALGMTSSTPWYGSFHANGGYIVVKEDGEVVCYHFFDRNDLEDYLFHNTKFDSPSRSRHDYGAIYRENDEYFLKLNLQVRFK